MMKSLKYFALLLGFAFYVLAFEPFAISEFAYVFAVPILLAARFGGFSKKAWLIVSFLYSWISWMVLLVWLRFVYPPTGVFFLLTLSAIVAAFMFVWMLFVRAIAKRNSDEISARFFNIFFLTSLWVFLEWLRSFIFTGFPWLLLAHSQWTRPAMIQTAEFGGPYIVSFVLMFFNLALAEFFSKLWRLHQWKLDNFSKEKKSPKPAMLSLDMYTAVLLLMGSFFLYVYNIPNLKKSEKAFRVGMVQTDFAGIMNWDANLEAANLNALRNLSLGLQEARVDLVIWPESAMPPRYAVNYVPELRVWVESFVNTLNRPVLMGNSAVIEEGDKFSHYNAAFAVSPQTGLDENFYAKQKLVPFGEYKPSWCFFLDGTVIPVGTASRGTGPVLFDMLIAGKNYKVGSIICYEDIFPEIGRGAAAAGAELLFVCTNDSWYGREGGAWQHAAHSAFQAVSTRRPLLRASINGLSGVFDQYGRMFPSYTLRDVNGNIFDGTAKAASVIDLIDEQTGKPLSIETLKPKRGGPMVDDRGSIYFRGAAYADLEIYPKFDGVQTFYVRYGDWLPKACTAFLLFGLIFIRKKCLTNVDKK